MMVNDTGFIVITTKAFVWMKKPFKGGSMREYPDRLVAQWKEFPHPHYHPQLPSIQAGQDNYGEAPAP